MKKLFTSFALVLTAISALAQTHTLTLATNDASLGTVSYKSSDEGSLSGVFSVSSTKKVRFSKGNLQYITTGTHSCSDSTTKSGTWRFAENQYDYIGVSKKASYTDWCDLFHFGTSGAGGVGNALSIGGTALDWGVYNAISNGGDKAGLWRTLSQGEWKYLFSHGQCGLGKVNGISGLIILPDNWVKPDGVSYTVTISNFTTNRYTIDQWSTMEAAGALFLPSSNGTGHYWSTTSMASVYAYAVEFYSNYLGFTNIQRE